MGRPKKCLSEASVIRRARIAQEKYERKQMVRYYSSLVSNEISNYFIWSDNWGFIQPVKFLRTLGYLPEWYIAGNYYRPATKDWIKALKLRDTLEKEFRKSNYNLEATIIEPLPVIEKPKKKKFFQKILTLFRKLGTIHTYLKK